MQVLGQKLTMPAGVDVDPSLVSARNDEFGRDGSHPVRKGRGQGWGTRPMKLRQYARPLRHMQVLGQKLTKAGMLDADIDPSRRFVLQLTAVQGFFLRSPPIALAGTVAVPVAPPTAPFTAPAARPAATPPSSGTNFGSEVVPSTANGMPLPPVRPPAPTLVKPPATPPLRLATILKPSAPPGLIVPAPVITPIAGTSRLIASSCVPAGETFTLLLRFRIAVSG